MAGDILFLYQVFFPCFFISTRNESWLPPLSHHVQESSSSDDHDEEVILATLHAAQAQHMNAPRWGGSVPGREYTHCDREATHQMLYNDYFSEYPTYGPTFFRRRFAITPLSLLRVLKFSTVIFLIIIYSLRFRMSRSLYV
jgi:hypothetical protein